MNEHYHKAGDILEGEVVSSHPSKHQESAKEQAKVSPALKLAGALFLRSRRIKQHCSTSCLVSLIVLAAAAHTGRPWLAIVALLIAPVLFGLLVRFLR